MMLEVSTIKLAVASYPSPEEDDFGTLLAAAAQRQL